MRSRSDWMRWPLLAGIILAPVIACQAPTASETSAEQALEEAPGLVPMDLAILFPIAASKFDERLLRPKETGPQGQFIPTKVIEALKPFSGTAFDNAFDNLRAASVRIDPCANIRTAHTDAECMRQVRVVWQWVSAADSDAQDFNVHGIYTVSDAQFRTLVSSIDAVAKGKNAEYAHLPLQPHPRILKEGMDGVYAKTVLDGLRAVIGEKTLTKAAIMAQTDQSIDWTFSIVGYVNGKVVQRALPTLSRKKQVISEGQGPPFDTVTPTSREPDEIMRFQGKLAREGAAATPKAEADRVVRSSFRIENPAIHDPTTIDCGSCHLATVTRLALELASFATPENAQRFASSRWNLDRISQESPTTNETLQMFGWAPGGDPAPSIRQRVINESAAAVDYVNEHKLALPPQ